MPAIARSEPFAQQACPLGVCDGSGWILGPEDVGATLRVPRTTPEARPQQAASPR